MSDKKRSRSNGATKEPPLTKKAKVATPSKSATGGKKSSASAKKATPASAKKSSPAATKKQTAAAVKKAGYKTGQKHDIPNGDDPCRAYYESLHQQKPESTMAAKWCLEYGLLEDKEIKTVLKQIERGTKAKKSPAKTKS